MQFWQIKKKIADGKVFLAFSICFAIFVRVVYCFLLPEQPETFSSQGPLWNAIQPFFSSHYLVSISTSAILVVSISIFLSYTNTKFILIREKTMLPQAFALFLLSCHPIFFITSPYLIAVATSLGLIHSLFNNYQSHNKSIATSNITISLLIGSLFVPSLLLFYILILFGFILMRIFDLRSIIASLFTVIIIYTPFLLYYYLMDNIDSFIGPFTKILDINQLPIISFSIREWTILIFIVLILIIASSHYIINSYKEKIKNRALLNLLIIYLVLAALYITFIHNIHSTIISTAICPTSLLLSHYFALSKARAIPFLFFYLIITFLLICYNTLL